MLQQANRSRRLFEEAREPIEMLAACHEKIRHFTDMAVTLAKLPRVPEDQIAEAAAALGRYFGLALPLHERDEEDSVAPRLLDSSARAETEDALARMTAEHHAIDGILAKLNPLWLRLSESAADSEPLGAELREHSQALAAITPGHLELEESILFPAITRTLSTSTRAAILAEIKARRTPEVLQSMAAVFAKQRVR
jgi:hypothetical protein